MGSGVVDNGVVGVCGEDFSSARVIVAMRSVAELPRMMVVGAAVVFELLKCSLRMGMWAVLEVS